MKSVRVDKARLQNRMEAISAFGATAGCGVTRLALSDADKDARQQLSAWLKELDCEIHVDGMGNIFAVLPGKDRTLPPVMTGSHGDSQPLGGRFDGMLGVVAGVEVVSALRDAGVTLLRDLVVADWTNEEGSRFTPGCSGSGVWAGKLAQQDMYALKDQQGLTLGGELARIGFQGDSSYFPRPVHAAFELHIEQGPVLEEKNIPIGIPQGIVCLRWYNVRVQGVPNHAGPTPMTSRHDAIYAFSLMTARIFEIARSSGQVVATVGEVHASPNSRNVIAGDVQFTIDVRGWDETATDDVCQRIEAALTEAARQTGCQVTPERIWQVSRVPFDQRLRGMVREAATSLGLPCLDMVSGASHDMIYIAQVAPGAMIFVPSMGGRSHAEVENTSWEDCAAGADVLLHCLMRAGNEPAEQDA
ncbi:N-carbamoyl-L-amino-acid hydrolase [anaerobic digester metagenome]